MSILARVWNRLEEAFIAFLLAAMTLITFVYVVLNNIYPACYQLAEWLPFLDGFFVAIGDWSLDWAQWMTWSNALTKALFGWLIFFGIAYGVRIAGHIGVDALVKLAAPPLQRTLGLVAVGVCLLYAGMMLYGSIEWVSTLLRAGIGAEDLDDFGIMQGHIGLIVPIGFALVLLRFIEIGVRILRGQQTGLGLADEAGEAIKLAHIDGHSDAQTAEAIHDAHSHGHGITGDRP